jgi:aquaporin Z
MYNYLAEFAGTTLLVYVILATANPLAIGAVLALIMLILTKVSGGYVNPAVTITMAAAGKLPVSDIIPYVISQCVGGLVALQLYKRFTI